MDDITFNDDNAKSFVSDKEIAALQPEIDRLHVDLEQGQGAGSDCLGWLHLPSETPATTMDAIESTRRKVSGQCNAFVCIGIGGSFLGARAGISFLSSAFGNSRGPEIFYAGQNLDSDYHSDLLERLVERDVCINVISKSGTSTEPSIAFRLLRDFMIKKYGKEGSRERIVVTTDAKDGPLKRLADEEGYVSLVIPDNVGGRYSVLTPVGLFPMAVAGVDIRAVMEGALKAEKALSDSADLSKNSAYRYAANRHLLFRKGKTIELFAAFQPSLEHISEWWKQLAGESGGKEGGGIFPASVQYTADLHSLGQWVQEGNRILFETFLWVENPTRRLKIPEGAGGEDGVGYLAGKTLDFVSEKAYKGAVAAHLEGEVPSLAVTLKERSAQSLGQLFYFFERAVAMAGYLSKVNPFDQPGVESYKRNMFTLLKKPGYEKDE
jgi:glucose-6-phosphate isomerase